MTRVSVAALAIYPVKALGPLPLDRATLLPSGCLAGDRRYALVDESGGFLNGKRERNVHFIRVLYDGAEGDEIRGRLWFGTDPVPPATAIPFTLPQDGEKFAAQVSNFIDGAIRLVENPTHGFPDDTEASGPTLISSETLTAFGEVCGLPIEELRPRFRANVEVVGGGPFWEDRAFGPEGAVVPLRIGEARLLGDNPCRRCVVPGRDPYTGKSDPGFSATLTKWREATLPPHAERERFKANFFRLALNTRPVPNAGVASIAVGDDVEIVGPAVPLESNFDFAF